MVAIHSELNRLAGPGPSNWISQVRRRSSLLSKMSHLTFDTDTPNTRHSMAFSTIFLKT